jgi:hypothetical protein
MDDQNMHAYGEAGPDNAEIGRQWREDSSLEKWFPLTAERLEAKERENLHLAREARTWWEAAQTYAADAERLREALRAVLQSNVSRKTLTQLAEGQGTATEEGNAWDAHVCPKQALKDGRTLEDWLKDQPKTAPEVAAAFVRGMVDGDGWPKLTKPARVGNGTFGVGVSARLVVEAAQRQHEYHAEDAARTPEQAREHERKRREAWDMLNGPLGT